MPEISRFLGIVIFMYFKDHNPPHFHVKYNEHTASINIETMGIVEGKLSPKVLSLVIEWAAFYQNELIENWQKLQNLQSPLKIKQLA